jgi:hypothetical protein
MHCNRTIAFLLAAIALSALASTQAYAAQRTHVSAAFGDDANTASNCTPVAPCRTFQAAMTVTDSNGEVVVLDGGDYGAVTITQSVALIAPKGVYAGISVFPGADGVAIDTAGINVVLRGLSIKGQGGDNGIIMFAGNRLTIENCVISNFLGGNGIVVRGTIVVRVTNTIIRDNGFGVRLEEGAHGTITRATISGHSNEGVSTTGSLLGTATIADIADSTIDGNGIGITGVSLNAGALVKISIRDSRVMHNDQFGLVANSSQGGAVNLSASNNIVSNNEGGIAAVGNGAKVWASGNTVSDNRLAGLQNNGDTFSSAGNNAVRNNGMDFFNTIRNVGTK